MSTLTIVGPGQHVAHTPLSGVETGRATVLDLTNPILGGRGTLNQSGLPGNVEWIDGSAFAQDHVSESVIEHTRWLRDVTTEPRADGRSLKETFVYESDGHMVSCWWWTDVSKKSPISSPYPWLFYAARILEHGINLDAYTRCQILVEHADVGDALARLLQGPLEFSGEVMVLGAARDRDGVRLLKEVGRRVAAHLVRAVRPHSTAPLPWARPGALRILVQTTDKGSWIEHEAAHRNRYFGDVLDRLEARDAECLWMPACSGSSIQGWKTILKGTDRPNALPWMTVEPVRAAHILRHVPLWAAAYRRVFRGAEPVATYRGVDLSAPIALDYRRMIFGGGFLDYAFSLERQRSAIHALQPDVVLQRNEFMRNARTLAAAVAGKIPLVSKQHGLFTVDVGVYSYASDEVEASPRPGRRDHVLYCPSPDRIAAFGEHAIETWSQYAHFPRERMANVGGVRHDALIDEYVTGRSLEEQRAYARGLVGLPVDRPVLLLAVTFHDEVDRWIEWLTPVLRTRPDYLLAVKPHRHFGTYEYTKQKLDDRGIEHRLFREQVYELAAGADVLLCGTSTLLLEAYLLRTPVLRLQTSGSYEAYPYTRDRIGIPVRSAADLEPIAYTLPTVDDAYLDDRDRILRRHLNSADGRASERLATLLGLAVPSRAS